MKELPQSSVTEGLSVNQDAQPGEKRSRLVIVVLLIILILGGVARYLMGDQSVSASVTTVQPQPAQPQSDPPPFSVPKQ